MIVGIVILVIIVIALTSSVKDSIQNDKNRQQGKAHWRDF